MKYEILPRLVYYYVLLLLYMSYMLLMFDIGYYNPLTLCLAPSH